MSSDSYPKYTYKWYGNTVVYMYIMLLHCTFVVVLSIDNRKPIHYVPICDKMQRDGYTYRDQIVIMDSTIGANTDCIA